MIDLSPDCLDILLSSIACGESNQGEGLQCSFVEGNTHALVMDLGCVGESWL